MPGAPNGGCFSRQSRNAFACSAPSLRGRGWTAAYARQRWHGSRAHALRLRAQRRQTTWSGPAATRVRHSQPSACTACDLLSTRLGMLQIVLGSPLGGQTMSMTKACNALRCAHCVADSTRPSPKIWPSGWDQTLAGAEELSLCKPAASPRRSEHLGRRPPIQVAPQRGSISPISNLASRATVPKHAKASGESKPCPWKCSMAPLLNETNSHSYTSPTVSATEGSRSINCNNPRKAQPILEMRRDAKRTMRYLSGKWRQVSLFDCSARKSSTITSSRSWLAAKATLSCLAVSGPPQPARRALRLSVASPPKRVRKPRRSASK